MPEACAVSLFHDSFTLDSYVLDPVASEELLREMVASTRCGDNTDSCTAATKSRACNQFLGSRRSKTHCSKLSQSEPYVCLSSNGDVASLSYQETDDFLSYRCSADELSFSSRCQFGEVDSHIAMAGDCLNKGDVPELYTVAQTPFPEASQTGYAQAISMSGWMYVNQHGQMCGPPYIQEQLYEDLSTGFLPAEFPVYPVVNGSLYNPVLLMYFKLYPHDVSTGFMYMASSFLSVIPSKACEPSDCPTSGDKDSAPKPCKVKELVGYGANSVNYLPQLEPQSSVNYSNCILAKQQTTAEASNQSSLHSLMEYPADIKAAPCTLFSIANVMNGHSESESKFKDASFLPEFFSKVSEEVSVQLHSGIMKMTRRVVLDEIISSIIPDLITSRKSQLLRKPDSTLQSCKSEHAGGDSMLHETSVACGSSQELPVTIKSVGSPEDFWATVSVMQRKRWSVYPVSPAFAAAVEQDLPCRKSAYCTKKQTTQGVEYEPELFICEDDCSLGFKPRATASAKAPKRTGASSSAEAAQQQENKYFHFNAKSAV